MALCGQSSAKCQAKLRQASCRGGGASGPGGGRVRPKTLIEGFTDNIPEFGKQRQPTALSSCGLEGFWHRYQSIMEWEGLDSPHPEAQPSQPKQHRAASLSLGRPSSSSQPGCTIPSGPEVGTPTLQPGGPPAHPSLYKNRILSLACTSHRQAATVAGKGAAHSGKPRIINHTALIHLPTIVAALP